jgi:hypothetical protein
MNQNELNRSLSRATGESVRTIKRLGISLFDPGANYAETDSIDLPPQVIDWDQLELTESPWRFRHEL